MTAHRGWKLDVANSRLDAQWDGTRRLHIDSSGAEINGTFTSSGALTVTAGGLTVTAGGLTVTAGGLLVTAGGFVLTAGVLSVDDATESSSAVTGSIHTDGGIGIAKNAFFGLTIENSDGVGADGEQLTSGGAAAVTDWAAAASLREFKHLDGERTDSAAVLDQMVKTPVYDFKYRSREEALPGEHIMSTGDIETTYTGIVADEAPWAMHHHGKILNPINTFGHTVLAIKALAAQNKALSDRLEAAGA